jgi:hypothetical protein
VVYEKKLISPTTAEKLAGFDRGKKKVKPGETPKISEIRWKKMQKLIMRSPAKPSVKPIEKITEPWTPPAPDGSAFGVVPEEDDLY